MGTDILKSPMLASALTEEKIERLLPLYAQPKLDGIRMMVNGGVAWARSLKRIPNENLQRKVLIYSRILQGLDGELIAGEPTHELARNRTHKAVMARGANDPDVRWYVYDSWEHESSFEERLWKLASLHDKLPPFVHIVETRVCTTMRDVEENEAHFLRQGYEGMILRNPRTEYIHRRSGALGHLIKVKRFVDTEATVVDFVEEMQNTNEQTTNELGQSERSSHKAGLVPKGRLGALIARGRFPNGREYTVRIGSGFNHAQREEYWREREKLIGQFVTFKYLPVGVKDAPVNPIFLGFRDRLDTDEGSISTQGSLL